MTEAFLHYVWQHKLLNGPLVTTDGRPVAVLRTGEANHDAGPDFFNAQLRIGNVEWIGNIELHINTSDWNSHGHSTDPAYNNVILHAVYNHDVESPTLENGQTPPTLQMADFMPDGLFDRYLALVSNPSPNIACADSIADIPAFVIDGLLDRLLVERIESKSATARRLLDESRGSWEQTCYWLFAHYFGGKVNGIVFELLAKATDQRLLARWKDDPTRLEALLMGQAGLLDGYFDDQYPRMLQADYEAIAQAASLRPIDGYLWKFFRLRPTSFPTIRISQFADLIAHSSNLFATLLDTTSADDLTAILNRQASAYWDDHYRFDTPTERHSPKRLGKAQAQLIIINAWVPLLFVYGSAHSDQRRKEQALDILRQLDAEDNNIIRRWKQAGITIDNAARSQSLLQLYNNYCTNRRCLDCRIGYNIIRHS